MYYTKSSYKTAKTSKGNPKEKKLGNIRTKVTKAKEILAKAIKEMHVPMTDGFTVTGFPERHITAEL
jgi:hypothetical protein